MAKKLKHEDLILNIIVNGNPAQAELGKLGRQLKDAKSKYEALKDEMRLLEKQGQQNTTRYRDLTNELQRQQAVIDSTRAKIEQYRESLKLENQTQKDLETTLRKLLTLRKQTIPGTEQHKKYTEQINQIQSRLAVLRAEVAQTSNTLGGMAGNMSRYFTTMLGGAFAVSQLISWTTKATEVYTVYDDKLSDVMKTTNQSRDAVVALSMELDKIDTRTSDDDLLGIARIGGKLGINDIDELRGFVESSNQLVVALNQDLGGDVEQTINAVGKLAEIFDLKDLYGIDTALLKVGSTLNELGMASSASEGYMVEFSRRLAGVAPLAGITLQETLALAATLDQLGQTSEVSSTSLSKLFLKMSSDAEKFAKYAGMSVDDFKQSIETDFMGTFVKLLDGIRGNSQGLNELAATLGDIGIDAQRTTGVVGSLANNTDILTKQIDLANKSFDQGISLTNEYNIKNNNTAAALEKSRKEVTRMWRELGEKLWPVVTTGNHLLTTFLKILSTTFTFIANNHKWIGTLAVAITTLTIAVQAATIASYAKAKALAIAAAAQRLWNLALVANPIGLVITAITTLIAGLALYSRRTDEATAAAKSFRDVQKSVAESTAAEQAAIERNLKVATDRNKTDAIRLSAVKELRALMPSVLKNYSDEAIMAGTATKAIKEQARELIKLATIKAYQSKLDDMAVEKANLRNQKERGFRGATFTERLGTLGNMFSNNYEASYTQTIDNRIKAVEIQEGRFAEEVSRLQADAIKKITKTDNNDSDGSPIVPIIDDKETAKAAKKVEAERKKAFAKSIEDAEKHYQDLLQKEGLFRKDKKQMTSDELEKLLKIEEDYQAKIDDIHRKHNEPLKTTESNAQKELTARLLAQQKYIDSLINQQKKESEIEKVAYQDRLTNAGLFGVERENMTTRQLAAFEILERQHKANLAKIDTDAYNSEYQRLQREYDTQLADIRIRHNEELASVTTLEQAKERLKGVLSARELAQIKTLQQARRLLQNQNQLEEQAATRAHLEKLLTILQSVMQSGKWDGLSLSDSILSDEEKENLAAKIREVKEELAKLKGVDMTDDIASKSKSKTDILGMSQEDWEQLFENIQQGKIDIQGMLGAVSAGIQIWDQYNKFVANKENAQLQTDEAANNKKKDNLKKRLDSGAISQESYNKQIEKLDKDLDRKKAIIARNQAKRERNVALMTSIVNTAKAVTSVLPNLILAAIVGAFGGLQIATIASTPLPEIPGAESGGQFLNVTRSQDGKQFRAKSDPTKRGYVANPTVLVGENGTEWVASAQAVSNPAIKPIIDVLDVAQRQGNISALTAADILASMPGLASGGHIGSVSNTFAPTSNNLLEQYAKALTDSNKVLAKLSNQLDKPITAKMAMLGKDGFIEVNQEYQNIINNSSL